MRTNLQGFEIEYDVQGQGVPLLLMHAFPLDRRMLCEVPGAQLVTFDAPGAGKSPAPRKLFRMEDLAQIAADLLDELRMPRAVVGGVSMGGYGALAFARRYPDRLLGLVLSNTRVAADTPEGKQARREMTELARTQGAAEIARRMLPRLLGETTQREKPALVERVRTWIEEQSPEGLARLLHALAERRDSRDLLPAIPVPVLVIAGEEDVISTPEECREWTARLPDARLEVIAQAGHLPVLEQPALWTAAVAKFVRAAAG